jgi:hypothetical protein
MYCIYMYYIIYYYLNSLSITDCNVIKNNPRENIFQTHLPPKKENPGSVTAIQYFNRDEMRLAK